MPSKFFMENCLGVINQGDELKQGFYDKENGYGNDPRLLLLFRPNKGPISASRYRLSFSSGAALIMLR